jgi:hypothetical protein
MNLATDNQKKIMDAGNIEYTETTTYDEAYELIRLKIIDLSKPTPQAVNDLYR